MLKKILIIILIILVVGVVGIVSLAFYNSKKSESDSGVSESLYKLLSFGGSEDRVFTDIVDDYNDNTDFTNTNTNTDTNTDNDISINGDDVTILLLRKVANFPVTGVSVTQNKQDEVSVKFVARENGHIYQTSPDSSAQERISNTTILRIKEAFWLSTGEAFVARFLNEDGSEVDNFYAEFNHIATSTEGTLDGEFLESGIKEITLADDKDKIFYLVSNKGGSVGIVSDPNGEMKKQIFESPLSQWQVDWPGGNKIALTTKPHSSLSGYLYFLDANTGSQTRILFDIKGLTTLVNSDITKVLFTQNKANKLLLSIHDVKNNKDTELPVWTLSEKCVWSKKKSNIIYCAVPNTIPNGVDLDLWYQGLIGFSDNIWIIDINTQTSDILIDLKSVANESIDVIKLVLSPDEKNLFFINKSNSMLWQLRLE